MRNFRGIDASCKYYHFRCHSNASLFSPLSLLGNNVSTAELSTIELSIGILSACLPTYRPLYNHFFGKKAAATETGRRSNGNSAVIMMANMRNSWPGHCKLSNKNDEDEERLYTSTRLGTTTEVKGDEETGEKVDGEILVTKEFTAVRDD